MNTSSEKGPVRVLQVIGKMDYAGAETMIMNFYRSINRSRFQFDFLVFSEEQGAYDNEIESLGGKIYRLPPYRVYNAITFRKGIKDFFEYHPYEIVHGHIRSSASIYLDEAKKRGAYTIAHCHATRNNNILIGLLYSVLTYKIRYIADYFFACSQKAGEDGFGKKVVQSNRFSVLRNAIDTKRYIFSKEKHEKLETEFKMKENFVIGHVGRFSREKNHEFILEVFAEALRRNEKVRLVLVGTGELKPKIEKRAEEMNLKGRVDFLGARDDVPELLNLFDVFLFPSLFEGLGVALIEAQAAGLPCITSDAIVDEAIVTEYVKRISLNSSVDIWAKKLLDYAEGFKRKDCSKMIADKGYDLNDAVKQLEMIYTKGILK